MSSKSRPLPDFESRSVALFATLVRSGGRAEADAEPALAILPHSFEDMDENKDGLVDSVEYQRAFGR
ncbi:MAG: hypothetical protein ABI409_10185 [Ramlibacter sp.]